MYIFINFMDFFFMEKKNERKKETHLDLAFTKEKMS